MKNSANHIAANAEPEARDAAARAAREVLEQAFAYYSPEAAAEAAVPAFQTDAEPAPLAA